MTEEITPFRTISPGKTTFDRDEREKIIRALKLHMERMGFRVPTLADKIGLDYKTMYRFLEGETRTKDIYVYYCFQYLQQHQANHDGESLSALGQALDSFFSVGGASGYDRALHAQRIANEFQGAYGITPRSLDSVTERELSKALNERDNISDEIAPNYSFVDITHDPGCGHLTVEETVINSWWETRKSFKSCSDFLHYEGILLPFQTFAIFVLSNSVTRLPKFYIMGNRSRFSTSLELYDGCALLKPFRGGYPIFFGVTLFPQKLRDDTNNT